MKLSSCKKQKLKKGNKNFNEQKRFSKKGKEKQLVVVREEFPNNGSTERFEKDIEYYQKHKAW
ncbi:hypothetical protein DRF60_00015 [Chryseobacterium elymi]|uniref:Uncharacterized protein n=1 Tax=Chryseobacterium elymi TaxID=395936 RepID=A0A3D9DQ48_9FLAO|nr:hypothetical protein [Chryseobacterium elymi]REC80142.1 hypothetical protein DRF60_00015 [Chryseobacterium elymi]